MRWVTCLAAALWVSGCSKGEDEATVRPDSVMIPLGPGTDPGAIVPPDTPQSKPEAAPR